MSVTTEVEGTPAPPAKPPMTFDVMVAKYVALRDKKAAIKKGHVAQLAPYNEALDMLEARMLAALQGAGQESSRTLGGTAYKVVRTDAKVSDWPKVLEYIRENDAWELLESRVVAAGGRVWQTPYMLHAKAMLFDDEMAVSGSANLDSRSMFLNYELMVAFYAPEDVRRFADVVEQHRAHSQPYRAAKPGLWRDFAEGLVLWLGFQL